MQKCAAIFCSPPAPPLSFTLTPSPPLPPSPSRCPYLSLFRVDEKTLPYQLKCVSLCVCTRHWGFLWRRRGRRYWRQRPRLPCAATTGKRARAYTDTHRRARTHTHTGVTQALRIFAASEISPGLPPCRSAALCELARIRKFAFANSLGFENSLCGF